MSPFEQFKQKLSETYPDRDKEGQIYKFMYDFFDCETNPLNGELKENADRENYDSYGNEDSVLKRVFFFPEFSIFVQFEGTRQSYVGEEWIEMKEVKPTTKTIETYE